MSIKDHKTPILKNRSLFNESKKKKNNLRKKSISLNSLTIITKNKRIIDEKPNKALNIIEFIKQKKKFVIENTFDVKGTREFLASKEVAMRAIKLNDEIEIKNIKEKIYSVTNKNLMELDAICSPKNRKHKSTKAAGKGTISPRKLRKNEKRKYFEENNNEDKENKKLRKNSKKKKDKISNNSSNIESNSDSKKDKNNIMDKEDNDNYGEDEIYKFFIDNANEPDDNFQKKYKKEIKKFQSFKNVRKEEGENRKHSKYQSKKDLHYKRPRRLNSVVIPNTKPTKSQFLFSEVNKNKMKEDDINVSSIDDSVKACASPKKANKKKVKRHFGSLQINNKQIKEKFYKFDDKKINENLKEDNESKEGIIEIKSDQDSLISILSDLM